jgi:wyosine [tRNA(Phe)-imidazoG37] synthetase (radical SAM superfamily)
MTMLTFGPVPSRRLGRSLGINNIPRKVCSYSCVYCQLGPTDEPETSRRSFYPPERIFQEVEERLAQLKQAGESVDYLTFVPDGEPTLDARLGETLALLLPLGIPVAIVSNGSLIGLPEVRECLAMADWVSLKVDTTQEELWRRINRPHPQLQLEEILESMVEFTRQFTGTLTTESMLIRGLNDTPEHASRLAGFLDKLIPDTAYLAVPTRPPAEAQVQAPDEATVNRIFQVMSLQVEQLELLTEYEGNAFASTGNLVDDILAITSVHPMREEAVREMLGKAGETWSLIEGMLADHRLIQTTYKGHKYYMRSFP